MCKVSVVPPSALHGIGPGQSWLVHRPAGCSPLLVFVNPKSGDHMGERFLRRFRQLLNPAQVYDLMESGPSLGLRLFRSFEQFRILVCGGDGSVGWVLSQIDSLDLHKRCQVGVLPLGTGNDLARVLGWGSTCYDTTNLIYFLEKYECATIKMLDRWSISTIVTPAPLPLAVESVDGYESSVAKHLAVILHSGRDDQVLSSANVLCKTIRDLTTGVGDSAPENSELRARCSVLDDKLCRLMQTLNQEAPVSSEGVSAESEALSGRDGSCSDTETSRSGHQERSLMTRANSLKKAVRDMLEHVEMALDAQNAETVESGDGHHSTSSRPVDIRIEVPLLEVESASPEFCSDSEGESAICGAHSSLTPGADGDALSRRVSEEMPSLFGAVDIASDPGESLASDFTTSHSATVSPLPSVQYDALATAPTSAVGTPPGGSTAELPLDSVSSAGEREEPDKQGRSGLLLPLAPARTADRTGEMSRDSQRQSTRATSELAGAIPRRLSSLTGLLFGRSSSSEPVPPAALAASSASCSPLASPSDGHATQQSHWHYASETSYSMVENVLIAHADALCAPASPLTGVISRTDVSDADFLEKGVMNNYFGIGIDAKISLDFHNKREGQPDKCGSRTKNLMWYGMLGSKELIQKTCKNLEQRIRLECDGQTVPLPSLQGIVVLNIPSFMGGTNFWGRRRDDGSGLGGAAFTSPCFDDRVLEVVAVFGTIQMAASRIINLQHHRLTQCQSLKITILGDVPVPVEVDGEAWAQPPGVIRITHKNRIQMLARNRNLEVSLRSWQEKQLRRQSVTLGQALTDDEHLLLKEFITATQHLHSTCGEIVERHGKLSGCDKLQRQCEDVATLLDRLGKPASSNTVQVTTNDRSDVGDLVTSVRSLHSQAFNFTLDHPSDMDPMGELEMKLSSALSHLEHELRHVHVTNGVIHFSSDTEYLEKRRPSRGMFRLRLRRESRGASAPAPSVGLAAVAGWRTEHVTSWLHGLGLDEYRANFTAHDVRGPELLTLERRDLKDLGVHKVGHIKRIQQAIREIKNHP